MEVGIGFLPKNHEISQIDRRSAFDRVVINTDGQVCNCPLMVLNKNGSHTIDPIGCDYETCPAISKEIDNNPVIITSAVFYWLLYPRSWK